MGHLGVHSAHRMIQFLQKVWVHWSVAVCSSVVVVSRQIGHCIHLSSDLCGACFVEYEGVGVGGCGRVELSIGR